MTKFVYSRVLTIRETINVFAKSEEQSKEFLSARGDGDWYNSDHIAADHDEELSHSSWALVGQQEMPLCSVCGNDILERPAVFSAGKFTLCRTCYTEARDRQDRRLFDIIAEMVSERHPTTPTEKERTAPLAHTPR